MIVPWKNLQKSFPVLQWSREYNLDKGVSDFVAGITVGLTLIPQSIAYASLAGLEPQFGLYSSLCGGLIYLIFGTIPELNIAPTALLSLLTYSYTKNLSIDNVHAAILLCFLAGCIELLCGLLHLGFLVEFVSSPVVAGFTSAGAITIASSQVKNLIGLKFEAETFFDIWKNVFQQISNFKKWDALLGVSCCVILLLMRKLKDFGIPLLEASEKNKSKTGKKLLWLLSVGRNALIVVSCAAAALILSWSGSEPFSLTAKVPSGWPNVSLPSFQLEEHNKTTTFSEMLSELGTGIIFIPLIAILANVGIAKAFAHGKVVDASQEMVAVGLCNIIGSFFGSFPVNASFSRAAVGGASGVKTPFSGIYTAALVFLAFTLLTPYFSYIPKPTLAAVIICAVIFMIEVMMTKQIWITYKVDLIPFFVTLISCLILGIEIGILIGIFVDILKVLYISSRPTVLVEEIQVGSNGYCVKFTPTSSILFSSAEHIRKKVLEETIERSHRCQYVILNCERINIFDFTAVMCMNDLVKDLQKNGKQVFFMKLSVQIPTVKVTDILVSDADLENHVLSKKGINSLTPTSITIDNRKNDDQQLDTQL